VNAIDAAHHAHDDDLQLYILGRLSATKVDTLERHVSNCSECNDRLAATARFVAHIIDLKRDSGASDQRVGPRFRSSDAGSLRCFSPLLPDRWPIQVIDVSRNGLGLIVPTNLPPGALVQVHIGRVFALGEVRYSKQISEHQFRTGIRLQDFIWRE
jgi:anti-sigma factor RsiW